MKKIYLLIFISIVHSPLFSQDILQKFTHSYFRSDPYKSEFSVFLAHLLKDPAIANKEMLPRTDTSFFYFHGTYTNFNPFFFKPKRIEVILTETEVSYSESDPSIDTVYLYQLLAFNDYTPEGIEDVKKEFNRVNRQFAKKFFDSNHTDLKQGTKIAGGASNYFIPLHGVAPVTIAWGKIENQNSAVLSIVLRMKSSYNRAVSPAPFYQPQ